MLVEHQRSPRNHEDGEVGSGAHGSKIGGWWWRWGKSRQEGVRIGKVVEEVDEEDVIGWWILQMLVVVAFPVVLLVHVLLLWIGAVAQTVSDGAPVWLREFFFFRYGSNVGLS